MNRVDRQFGLRAQTKHAVCLHSANTHMNLSVSISKIYAGSEQTGTNRCVKLG